tara:strand:+ start:5992 stop:6705 length:714 start_codon:yes stop_codon:yes gene_type:complete
MPNLKKDSLEALIDLIVEMLPASSAEELVRTSKLTTPAIKEAQARISQGQSPYHVLTQLDSRDYGVDKQSRAVRALNDDYGPLSDPVHHGSGSDSDIQAFWSGTHFGTAKAAEDRINQTLVKDPAIYPAVLKRREDALRSEDAIYGPSAYGGDTQTDLESLLSTARENYGPWMPSKYDIDTVQYENIAEDPGSVSFVNTRQDVRSPQSQFNPNWRHLRDLLASTIPATALATSLDDE